MNRWAVTPFGLGFSIILVFGFIFQVILPEIFPVYFSNGVLTFLKDPIAHHDYAMSSLNKSWADFFVLPQAGLIYAIQAFVYKLTGVHHSAVMLPFLAVLSGFSIRAISSCFDILGVKGRWWPLLFAVIFTITPTSLSWMFYSYKESLIIPGFILITWTILSIGLRSVTPKSVISFAIGNILLLCSNSDLAPVLFVSAIWISVIISLINGNYRDSSKIFFLIFIVLFYGVVSKLNPAVGDDRLLNVTKLSTSLEDLNTSREIFLLQKKYGSTNFLPESHNSTFVEVLTFIPRALQLSLLEPLPWRNTDVGDAKEILFSLVKLEMFSVYLFLFFLITIGVRQKNPTILLCLALALPALIALGIAIPNIGTINRYRFPFLILIKMAGLAALWNSPRKSWPGRLLMWIDPAEINRGMKKIIFLVPDDATFIIQRLVMAQGVQKAGFDVHVASEDTGSSEKIRSLGFTFHKLDLNRGGINPFADFIPFIKLIFFLAKERPDILQCVSIKPVLYGATAGTIVGLKRIVCLINGRGYAFDGNGFKGKVIKCIAISLYRNALALPGLRVIFQNPDDLDYFVQNKLVTEKKTILIRGSGVNMEKFKPCIAPSNPIPVVLFVGRLLWNKGIKELVEAAKILKANYSFRLVIVGAPDERNPEAVPKAYLDELHKEGIIDWVGRQTDMPKFYRESDIICLPTQYKEGLPLTLLEAASTGRPLVATDVPGCREIVRPSQNGFLVEPKDVDSLKKALEILIKDADMRVQFGKKSSEIVRNEFSAEIIQSQLIQVYESLLNDALHSIDNHEPCSITS